VSRVTVVDGHSDKMIGSNTKRWSAHANRIEVISRVDVRKLADEELAIVAGGEIVIPELVVTVSPAKMTQGPISVPELHIGVGQCK
jgi:C4-type Zn-finger protein